MGGGKKIIGIDIGGTKIHAGLVLDGKMMKEIQIPTSALAPMEQIVHEIITAVEQVTEPDVVGIGVGVPGLVDEKQGIVHLVQNIPSWQEVPLKMYLEKHFKLPVCITNDANSFAAGEKMYGKGKRFNNMVGITLGTGFGTGIIIEGKLYSGIHASAGEFGGVPYLDKTIEDYCSGKFFAESHGMSGIKAKSLAEEGDAAALESFNQFGHHLGNALKIILYTLSPEAIFLGGSISGCLPFFEAAMQKSLREFPFKLVLDEVTVERSGIDNVAVLGAAALFQMRSKGSYAKMATYE